VKSESESVRCEMRWGCDAPDEAVQSVLVRTLNATRLRRNTVIVIVIGDRIRKRLESDTTRLYWCESHESGGGEKHAQNCVCMSSTALFLLAAPLAWRSSTQHCIGQETCRPASTAAQSAQTKALFIRIRRAVGMSRPARHDSPAIDWRGGVCASHFTKLR
jgi:hypothetical protein